MNYYENEQLVDINLNDRKRSSDIWKAGEMAFVYLLTSVTLLLHKGYRN